MSDLIKKLEQKQIKAERLAIEVYKNMPSLSFENPSQNVPKRFYKLKSIAVNIFKEICKLREEERKNKIVPKKTEGQLYAEAMEERRAIKEANVTSLTYERAKNRLDKQVERWIAG